MDKQLEEQIRKIVKEELAAQLERPIKLHPDSIADALIRKLNTEPKHQRPWRISDICYSSESSEILNL